MTIPSPDGQCLRTVRRPPPWPAGPARGRLRVTVTGRPLRRAAGPESVSHRDWQPAAAAAGPAAAAGLPGPASAVRQRTGVTGRLSLSLAQAGMDNDTESLSRCRGTGTFPGGRAPARATGPP